MRGTATSRRPAMHAASWAALAASLAKLSSCLSCLQCRKIAGRKRCLQETVGRPQVATGQEDRRAGRWSECGPFGDEPAAGAQAAAARSLPQGAPIQRSCRGACTAGGPAPLSNHAHTFGPTPLPSASPAQLLKQPAPAGGREEAVGGVCQRQHGGQVSSHRGLQPRVLQQARGCRKVVLRAGHGRPTVPAQCRWEQSVAAACELAARRRPQRASRQACRPGPPRSSPCSLATLARALHSPAP